MLYHGVIKDEDLCQGWVTMMTKAITAEKLQRLKTQTKSLRINRVHGNQWFLMIHIMTTTRMIKNTSRKKKVPKIR